MHQQLLHMQAYFADTDTDTADTVGVHVAGGVLVASKFEAQSQSYAETRFVSDFSSTTTARSGRRSLVPARLNELPDRDGPVRGDLRPGGECVSGEVCVGVCASVCARFCFFWCVGECVR